MADIIIIRNADEETINRIMNNQMEHGKGRLFHKKARESVDIEEKVEEKTRKEKKYVKMQKFVPNKFNNWTKKEDNILRKNYAKKEEKIDYDLLKSLLPDRTRGSIIHRACELKITNRHRKRNFHKRKSHKEQKTTITSSSNKWAKWTAQEDNILKEQYKPEGRINWKEIRKQMPHRTRGSINVRACQLKITNKNRHWGKKATRKARKEKKSETTNTTTIVKKSETQKQEDFVKKRSIQYQKNGYNEQDSRRMAMTDYQNFKGHKQTTTTYNPTNQQKKATIIEDFPDFQSIDKQWQPLIEGIVKHIVANKGSKLSYLNTRDILDVSSGKQWHEFVAEFMIKSNIISEYFNVQNKFKHLRTDEGYDIITYES